MNKSQNGLCQGYVSSEADLTARSWNPYRYTHTSIIYSSHLYWKPALDDEYNHNRALLFDTKGVRLRNISQNSPIYIL